MSPITGKFAFSLNNGCQHARRLTLRNVQDRLKRMHVKAFQDCRTVRLFILCVTWLEETSSKSKIQCNHSYVSKRCSPSRAVASSTMKISVFEFVHDST